MNLIYFPLTNCHLLCIINVVAALEKENYKNIFFNVWAETKFKYDKKHQICISKRIFDNLRKMGINIKKTNECSILDGELFLVGIDTFYVPWSPVYQSFNGDHYFIAQKVKGGMLACFDPIYNVKDVIVKQSDIFLHAFDVCKIIKTKTRLPKFKTEDAVNEVLRSFPKFKKRLCEKIKNCKNEKQKNIARIIKQTIAMMGNRYLFRFYMQQRAEDNRFFSTFFGDDFFKGWNAFKNGLYKASIIKENERLIDEVCSLADALLNKEIEIAKKLITNKKIPAG